MKADKITKALKNGTLVENGSGRFMFIPSNDYGIPEDYYSYDDILNLLRKHAGEKETIIFIADMLEL